MHGVCSYSAVGNLCSVLLCVELDIAWIFSFFFSLVLEFYYCLCWVYFKTKNTHMNLFPGGLSALEMLKLSV